MGNPYKIIFVCEWNTCRSAMAKYIFKELLRQSQLSEKFFVDSAGCVTRGGEPIGYRTRMTLQNKNIPLDEHISKRFTVQDYENFDCVIALDDTTLRITKKISLGDSNNKIRLFKDFDGRIISVADPGPTGEHLKAYEEILTGCKNLLNELKNLLNELAS